MTCAGYIGGRSREAHAAATFGFLDGISKVSTRIRVTGFIDLATTERDCIDSHVVLIRNLSYCDACGSNCRKGLFYRL